MLVKILTREYVNLIIFKKKSAVLFTHNLDLLEKDES